MEEMPINNRPPALKQANKILDQAKKVYNPHIKASYVLLVVKHQFFHKINFYVIVLRKGLRTKAQPIYAITDFDLNYIEKIVNIIHDMVPAKIKFRGFEKERWQETGDLWPKEL